MNQINFKRASFFITFRCTLNCKLCSAFVPYREKPNPHYTYEKITDSISSFFSIIDKVEILSLCGGEPFMHQSLPEMFDFISKYRSRITERLETVTNGSILPGDRLLTSLKKNNVYVFIDDYGQDLSPKLLNIIELFNEWSISFEVRTNKATDCYCGGWFDVGIDNSTPTLKRSDIDAKDVFNNCLQSNKLRCNPVVNGKMFVCIANQFLFDNGVLNDDSYFDFFDDSLSFEQKKHRLTKFLKLKNLSACSYCDGWIKDGVRHIPAQQI